MGILQGKVADAVRHCSCRSTGPFVMPADVRQLQIPRKHLMTVGETKGEAERRVTRIVVTGLRRENSEDAVVVHIERADEAAIGADVEVEIFDGPRVKKRLLDESDAGCQVLHAGRCFPSHGFVVRRGGNAMNLKLIEEGKTFK